MLTVSSYPTRTSPVIRGKYVLQNILGAPPPPPPPDVPALDEEAVGNAGSLRQQLEKHRSNAMCASCHSRMDVLGFGLENYDAIGKWRTMDGKFPVDSSGTLPNGKSFTTPAEMRDAAEGRSAGVLPLPDREDADLLAWAAAWSATTAKRSKTSPGSWRPSDYRFQTLIHEIVRSLPVPVSGAARPMKTEQRNRRRLPNDDHAGKRLHGEHFCEAWEPQSHFRSWMR